MVSLEPIGSQLPLSQYNPPAKVTHFGKACSEPLQAERGELGGIVLGWPKSPFGFFVLSYEKPERTFWPIQ